MQVVTCSSGRQGYVNKYIQGSVAAWSARRLDDSVSISGECLLIYISPRQIDLMATWYRSRGGGV